MSKENKKKCITCEEVLFVRNFSSSETNSICDYCWNNGVNILATRKYKKYKRNFLEIMGGKKSDFAGKIRRQYNMTISDYYDLFSEQKEKCAICDKKYLDCPRKKLYVDHCHEKGNVRGLVCAKCNAVLGMAQDKKEILKKAIIFLESS